MTHSEIVVALREARLILAMFEDVLTPPQLAAALNGLVERLTGSPLLLPNVVADIRRNHAEQSGA